ncbi:MAG: hypothetical protein GY948_23555 [Alphaproteobacteria bacterium]|nr:hypothetical protein [Alphaproteobacteria bacterium]
MRRIHGIMFKLPLMITCEVFEDFILAYLDDDLPPKQKFVFELHLKVCRECQEYLRAYRASIELSKKGGQADAAFAPGDVPEDLITAVVEARKA